MKQFDSLFESFISLVKEDTHRSLTFRDNVAATIKLAVDEKFRPDLKNKTWKDLDKVIDEAVKTKSFLLYTTTPTKPLVKLEFKDRGVSESFYVAAIDLQEPESSKEKTKEFNGFPETIFDDLKKYIQTLSLKYSNPTNAVTELPPSNVVTPDQAAAAGVPPTTGGEQPNAGGSALPK